MKVYVVCVENWRDSEEIDAIAYRIEKIFNSEEKAQEFIDKHCEYEDWAYIEEHEVF